MAITEMFHYTNGYAWKQMREGNRDAYLYDPKVKRFVDGKECRGLWPIRRFTKIGNATGVSSRAYDAVTFGFLEPEPASWTKNPEFPEMWWWLFNGIFYGARRRDGPHSIVLLKASFTPRERASVFDRAVVERFLYATKNNERMEERKQAFRRYWESRVPRSRYNGQHNMPELACWATIPLERITFCWESSCEELDREFLEKKYYSRSLA